MFVFILLIYQLFSSVLLDENTNFPSEITKNYTNLEINRTIYLLQHKEEHTIFYKISSTSPSKISSSFYYIHVPLTKPGILKSFTASIISTDEKESPLKFSESKNLFTFNGINFKIFILKIPSILSKEILNLKVKIIYTKPFETNVLVFDQNETKKESKDKDKEEKNEDEEMYEEEFGDEEEDDDEEEFPYTELLYKDFNGIFSVYKTLSMITDIHYKEIGHRLMRYTGNEDSNLPISFHAEEKELIYGPFWDIQESEGIQKLNGNENEEKKEKEKGKEKFKFEQIKIFFKTFEPILEIEKFHRIIHFNFFDYFYYFKNYQNNEIGKEIFDKLKINFFLFFEKNIFNKQRNVKDKILIKNLAYSLSDDFEFFNEENKKESKYFFKRKRNLKNLFPNKNARYLRMNFEGAENFLNLNSKRLKRRNNNNKGNKIIKERNTKKEEIEEEEETKLYWKDLSKTLFIRFKEELRPQERRKIELEFFYQNAHFSSSFNSNNFNNININNKILISPKIKGTYFKDFYLKIKLPLFSTLVDLKFLEGKELKYEIKKERCFFFLWRSVVIVKEKFLLADEENGLEFLRYDYSLGGMMKVVFGLMSLVLVHKYFVK